MKVIKFRENCRKCLKLREIEKVAESCGKWQKLRFRNYRKYIVPLLGVGEVWGIMCQLTRVRYDK